LLEKNFKICKGLFTRFFSSDNKTENFEDKAETEEDSMVGKKDVESVKLILWKETIHVISGNFLIFFYKFIFKL